MVFVCVWGSSLCSRSLFHCLMRGDRLSARLKPNPPSSPSHVSRHPTAAEAFFKMRPRIAHVRARAWELCPSPSSLQSFDSYLLRQVWIATIYPFVKPIILHLTSSLPPSLPLIYSQRLPLSLSLTPKHSLCPRERETLYLGAMAKFMTSPITVQTDRQKEIDR